MKLERSPGGRHQLRRPPYSSQEPRRPAVMEGEKVMSGMLLVWMVCGAAVATIRVDRTSEYCSRVHLALDCVFTNTSEEVEVREVGRGLLSVTVEGATALRGFPQCGTNLHVLSSFNVTLQGSSTHVASGVRRRRRRRRSDRRRGGADPESVGSPPGPRGVTTVHSTISERTVTSSVRRTSVSVSVSAEEPGAGCVRNVSVVRSGLRWLRGQFDEVGVQSSEVGELTGEIGRLRVQGNSTVSSLSVHGGSVSVEGSRIRLLSRLEVRRQLLLRDVHVGSLASAGLVLHEPQGGGGAHELSEVKVDAMETEAVQVMSGGASIEDLAVDEAHVAAFLVRDGGVLTLKNVRIRSGPTTCLILYGEARVVLLNFTLGSDTISDLRLASRGSEKAVYPLHTVWSAGDTILPRVGPKKPVSEEEEEEEIATVEIPGFPWYWVVIMSVVGIFSGVVVGSAVMWRRPSLMKGQPSALTLSDLIGRDGLQEETASHTSNTLQHPELLRQDSGLTSSSFASFTPCQERPQTASLFPKTQTQTPPDCVPESSGSEPSVYVHVAPLPCTSEVVIYEEVEALSAPKVDYSPPDEIKLTSELDGSEMSHSTEHVC